MATATHKSLKDIDVAYATASAGMHPTHTLPLKLEAIATAGFKWAEIAMPDLEKYASSKFDNYKNLDDTGAGDIHKLLEAASEIRELCQRLGIRALSVMPCVLCLSTFCSWIFTHLANRFSEYEGYTARTDVERGLKRARTWFRVLKSLDCQMLQVGSSDDPSISSDFGVTADNLRELADAAQAEDPPIRM